VAVDHEEVAPGLCGEARRPGRHLLEGRQLPGGGELPPGVEVPYCSVRGDGREEAAGGRRGEGGDVAADRDLAGGGPLGGEAQHAALRRVVEEQAAARPRSHGPGHDPAREGQAALDEIRALEGHETRALPERGDVAPAVPGEARRGPFHRGGAVELPRHADFPEAQEAGARGIGDRDLLVGGGGHGERPAEGDRLGPLEHLLEDEHPGRADLREGGTGGGEARHRPGGQQEGDRSVHH
jgi:hypothetical protein